MAKKKKTRKKIKKEYDDDIGIMSDDEMANLFGDVDTTDIAGKELYDLVKEFEDVPPQFISDMYHIVKHNGDQVLTDDRIEERCRKASEIDGKYWSHRSKWQKQKLFMTEFAEHDLLTDAFKKGAFVGTRDLLLYFAEAAGKFKEVFDQLKDQFGGDADDYAAPSNKWSFEEVKKWTGCTDEFIQDPINYDNILLWGMFLFDLVEDAQDDTTEMSGENGTPGGKVPYFTQVARTGNLSSEIVNLANQIEQQDLAIYGLAAVIKGNLDIDSDLEEMRKVDYHADKEVGRIEKIEESVNALPIEYAQDDDIFNLKMATKQLRIDENQKPEKVQNLWYILMDTSYSMDDFMPPFGVTRYGFGNSITLALLERVHDNKTKLYYRAFMGDVGDLMKAHEHDDIKELKKYIMSNGPGGGTDTENAIRKAIDDIAEAREGKNLDLPNLEKAEILVISDAEDTVNVDEINALKKKHDIRLNYILVNSSNHLEEQFQAISDKFLQLDGSKKLKDVLRLVE